MKIHSVTTYRNLMAELDKNNYSNLKTIGAGARTLLMKAELSRDLSSAIIQAYKRIVWDQLFRSCSTQQRHSRRPAQASFAGQHESYLNIKGEKGLLDAVKKCFASLYTDRAIKYREDNGFLHEKSCAFRRCTENGPVG
jgi:pyruvate,water dikinase